MKRFAAIALMVAASALPVHAQRGGSHGGFSGRASGSFHSGFGGSASSHFASAPRQSFSTFPRATRPSAIAPGFSRSGFGAYGARASSYPASRYRRPYRSGYGARGAYLFPSGIVSWINPDFLGYPGYYDNFSSAVDTADNGYAQPAEQEQPDLRGAYQPSYEPPAYNPQQPPPGPEDAVTIVFKDGRPAEQIHNYALTRTTLYVLDQQHRDIPIDQIDLSETERLNRDAGVEFQLPVTIQ